MLAWGPVNPILRLDSPETDASFHQRFLLERFPGETGRGGEGDREEQEATQRGRTEQSPMKGDLGSIP